MRSNRGLIYIPKSITEDTNLYYSMSPTTPNRLPEKSGVPRGFILNWQSSKAQGAKPLIRRPITACEACRAAKVKCNAKSDCQRCRNRGIKCLYTSANGSSESRLQSRLQRRSGSPTSLELEQPLGSSDISQERSIESSIDMEIDPTDISIPNNSTLNLEDLATWSQEMGEQFPWLTTDSGFDHTALHSTNLDAPDWNLTQLSPTYPSYQYPAQTTSESYNGVLEMPSGNLTSKNISNHAPPPHKEKARIICQCRSQLTLFIPKITSVMEESPTPKLDSVFKATREVIQSCQDMIDCTSCQLSCSDLMCLLVVFQHTDACFTHISKVDLTHATTVSIGGYEVSITDDIRPRQMLVMDLGRQANTLLDSITAVEETLAASPCAANRLNEVNSEFLKNVKDAFRANLQAVTDSVNRAT
ncbi:hypothetical protein BOTCAL_0941g00010 [Botryotinia calthae]|uniref:Zn(2)-C6 fungal-type domain-containing protein n=1 Tax=Botryotinia calthae TaxID=38488 RepID=A0A4Y8CGG0_9HELO|nr:hypothetical protein BOTCAL_0941g00010 [Botryotinia calthae]